MARPPSAVRRLGGLLAPAGPPQRVTAADLPDDVLLLAERQHLLPALRSALAGGPSAPALDRVKAAHVRNLARNLALVDQLDELLGALDRAGIAAAPLKGIDALLEGLYADWGARTMADLDVLVPPAAGSAAAAVLDEAGYVPVGDELPAHHHLRPMTAPGRVGVVEVHTGLHDRRTPAILDADEVLRRATPRPDRPGLRLDRTDAATHLVAHAQQRASRRRVELDLRALHETALVIDRGSEVDWALVRHRFAEVDCAVRLDAHLAAAGALFAVRPPVRLGAPGRWVARRELFVEDHPLLGLLDRPRHRLARLERTRLERYYGTPLSGRATWWARVRYLREAGSHRRSMGGGKRDPAGGVTPRA
ncbi:MAG TPA: nucleotidyltransferase family protein [Acidimicrobiales bacterium]|nr:nucleotidyltransferase family protein [Acidimicrobiales bacterium]